MEVCIQCGCVATMIHNHVVWNPDGPAHPFDWRFALVTFVMSLDDPDGLFTDTIEKWLPPYELKPGEREDLRKVELVVRELWAEHAPPKPERAARSARNIATENAAVDAYEQRVANLKGILLRLAVTTEWQSYFPPHQHAMIEEVRRIIIAHGGDGAV